VGDFTDWGLREDCRPLRDWWSVSLS